MYPVCLLVVLFLFLQWLKSWPHLSLHWHCKTEQSVDHDLLSLGGNFGNQEIVDSSSEQPEVIHSGGVQHQDEQIDDKTLIIPQNYTRLSALVTINISLKSILMKPTEIPVQQQPE